MELKKIEAIIEGILFTMGNSVEIDRLADAIEVSEDVILQAIDGLEKKYTSEDCGIQIVKLEDAVQLCTKSELFDYLVRIASQPKKHNITDTMLETLSIVAYKQPVTRMDIEKIRGVSCDHAVNKLIEYGLIEEVGRLDAPGRPILFATTEQFLRVFGVNSIGDLPQIDSEVVEEIKIEAEREIDGEARDLSEELSDTEDQGLEGKKMSADEPGAESGDKLDSEMEADYEADVDGISDDDIDSNDKAPNYSSDEELIDVEI